MRTRVMVIGAGFGGLASAVALAAGGAEVQVLEAAYEPGGKAGQVSVDGATFDTGPSLLTLPHIFDNLFARLGTTLADQVSLRRPDPAFRYHWPDGTTLDLHHDRLATLDSVRCALGATAAEELERFLSYAGRIWNAAAPAFVFDQAPSLHGLMRKSLRTLASLRHIDATSRMWRAIRKRVQTPHLRDLLARFATYNGSDVRRAPATLNCIAHVELTLGACGVEGGMHRLARALERVAIDAGVQIQYGARVKRILFDGRRVRGVELADGVSIGADAVVANADANHVLDSLLPLPNRRSTREQPSMSGWTALIRATRSLIRPAHSVLFPDHYLAEFADIFDRGQLPRTPTVYACAQGSAHGREGWPDAEPLFVMVNAPPVTEAGASNRAAIADVRDYALRSLRTAGLIADTDPIVWERDPAGLANRFPGSAGSIYGASSNSIWSAFRRPGNRVRGVRGLYLASGSAHPGGGVPLCVQSGMLAADALLKGQ